MIHTTDDLQNVIYDYSNRAGQREVLGKPEQWSWPLTYRMNGNGTSGMIITETLFWDKTLPVDAVGQQNSIQSALGEGRTIMIRPIKATLNGYIHIYVCIVLRCTERYVYIHTYQTKRINVVLLTTQLPHSPCPPPPSPSPNLFLPPESIPA